MKLRKQISEIQNSIAENRSLKSFTKALEKAAFSYDAPKDNPLAEVVVEFNRLLCDNGVFPMKFAATYWSQNGDPNNRSLELSWQRTDLILHKQLIQQRTKRSHGPGFRMSIYPDCVRTGLNHRFIREAQQNFSQNLIQDDGHLEHYFNRSIDEYDFDIVWFKDHEIHEADNFSDYKKYVKENFRKAERDYIRIMKPLTISSKMTTAQLAKKLHQSFNDISPFFYSMHFNLQPKKAKSHTSMKGQLTREQLRKQLLAVENQCQNQACMAQSSLQMCHLVPGYHDLSNVVALCPNCHDQQRPRNSTIKLKQLISNNSKSQIDKVLVPTEKGEKAWTIKSNHPLKRF